jgi:hypothetical protein
MPSLVFLLSLVDQQRMICKELKKKNLLSVGLVSIGFCSYIDYPIFIKPKSEYSNIFFQLILKLIDYNYFQKKI